MQKQSFKNDMFQIIFHNSTQGEIFVEMEEGNKCHSS
jgi:hypothetical protein